MNNEQIINQVSGLLTDEFQPLSEVIAVGNDLLGLKTVTVNFSINQLVKRGIAVKNTVGGEKMVKLVDDAPAPVVEPETPTVTKVAKFGTTKQIGNDGKEFNYVRKEFDGLEGQLSPAHEAKKNDLIMFKSVVREMVKECNGIGRVAITMYQPDISTRDDGKVFYRWDNPSKTEPVIDELHRYIAPMVEAMKSQQAEEESE